MIEEFPWVDIADAPDEGLVQKLVNESNLTFADELQAIEYCKELVLSIQQFHLLMGTCVSKKRPLSRSKRIRQALRSKTYGLLTLVQSITRSDALQNGLTNTYLREMMKLEEQLVSFYELNSTVNPSTQIKSEIHRKFLIEECLRFFDLVGCLPTGPTSTRHFIEASTHTKFILAVAKAAGIKTNQFALSLSSIQKDLWATLKTAKAGKNLHSSE
mgnify:CR=1 FL=1